MKNNGLNLLGALNRKAEARQVKIGSMIESAMYNDMISKAIDADTIKKVDLPLINEEGKLLNVQARLGIETSSATDQTGNITEQGRRGENMNNLEAFNKLANKKLFGSKAIKGFRYGVIKEHVLEDGTVEEEIVSPLANKMSFIMNCRNKYVLKVFLASKQLAAELLDLATKLDINALEDIDCLLLSKDISVFVRAAQEIAIDMTKDKTLTQIIELNKLLAPGVFLASQKMKNDSRQTNITSNARKFAQTIGSGNKFAYELKTPMADYMTEGTVNEEASSEELTICKAMRKVNDAPNLVVDTNYKVQERMVTRAIKEVFGPLVNAGHREDIERNIVAKETIARVKQDSKDVQDLAFAMAPATLAVKRKSYSLDINSDEYGDNVKLLSDDLRHTLKRLELAHPEVFAALSAKYAHIEDAQERLLNISCDYSMIKVSSEMVERGKDFNVENYSGITRRFATPEYLLTEAMVSNVDKSVLTKEFEVKTIKAYNVAEETEEQKVTIQDERFIVSEDGDVLGQVIHARVKDTSKYTLKLNDENEYVVVESEDIVSMIKKDIGNRFIVVTEMPEVINMDDEEFKIEDMVIVPGLEQEEIEDRLARQEELCDLIVSSEVMDYEPSVNLITLGDDEDQLELAPKADYSYVLGLDYKTLTVLNKLTLTHSVDDVIEAMESKIEQTDVVSYTIEDAFFSGTKLALVVSEM